MCYLISIDLIRYMIGFDFCV